MSPVFESQKGFPTLYLTLYHCAIKAKLINNDSGVLEMAGQEMLDCKVVVITGAGSGVGKGIALEAASHGARVIVNDIGQDESGQYSADTVVAEIRAAGGQAEASYDNIADFSGGQALVQCALDNYQHIDGVVNNAGVLRDKIFHKMSEEEFDFSIAVNLKGCFNVARAAAPHFKDQSSGAFVHMTSTSGLVGNFGQANYCSGKMGVVGLSKAIALDMQRFNVRSNCIAPFANTPMVAAGIPRETPEQIERWKIIERMEPGKIAPFTCALLTDAGSDVSGQIFGVRANEIFLFSQPRPIRTAHAGGEGWSTGDVVERVFPMFKPSFYPLDRSMDVFTWDPV
jgi:NAD(P)-dependent dehydrogenase (short-subunit alcohol dehydrogenase family)